MGTSFCFKIRWQAYLCFAVAAKSLNLFANHMRLCPGCTAVPVEILLKWVGASDVSRVPHTLQVRWRPVRTRRAVPFPFGRSASPQLELATIQSGNSCSTFLEIFSTQFGLLGGGTWRLICFFCCPLPFFQVRFCVPDTTLFCQRKNTPITSVLRRFFGVASLPCEKVPNVPWRISRRRWFHWDRPEQAAT